MTTSRRLVVWFAILGAVLVATAAPASAATTASENTTKSDFQSAQTSDNVRISGSGEGASIAYGGEIIEDFESGAGAWNGPLSTTDPGSIDSDPDGYVTTNDERNVVNRTFSNTTANITWFVRQEIITGESGNGITMQLLNDAGTRAINLEFEGDGDVRLDFTNVGTWTDDTNYKVKYVPDYGSGTADVYLNGNLLASTSVNINAVSGFDLVAEGRFGGGTQTTYLDDFEVGESTETNGTYTGAPHQVDGASGATVDIADITQTSVNWTVEGYNGNSWVSISSSTITSSGEKTQSFDGSSYSQIRNKFVFEPQGSGAFAKVDAEGVLFDPAPPSLSNPTPADGAQVASYDENVSINVSDADFGTNQGDTVTVQLLDDGSEVANQTLYANGSVEFSYAALAGSNTIEFRAFDSYSTTNASTSITFETPSELYIRSETDTSNLVTSSSNLTLRFFGGNEIVEKSTPNGVVNMTGLPGTEEVIVVARADGYYSRRVVLESLFEQQSIYLLEENETAVFNEFVVTDRTGRFSDNQTVLTIEKGIAQNNSTTWKTLAGDYLGGGGTFALYLEADARYRIFIMNGDAESRNLGPHVAAADGAVPITVGEIEWVAPSGDTYKYEARIDEEGVLRVNYADASNETDSLSIVIHERGNESNVLLSDTASDPNEYSVYHTLGGNETETVYQVELTAVRDGENLELIDVVGGVGSLSVPIDSRWLSLGSLLLVVAIAALVPSALSRVGAVGVVAVATGLSWFGFAPIPMTVIGLAGALALFGLAAQFRGR